MAVYDQGIAFIVEGETERVFYEEYLSYLVMQKHRWDITELDEIGVISYKIQSPKCTTIIKMFSADTITQIPHSGIWFTEECFKLMPLIPWTVILGYDTDGYKASITKFHEGDWARLRKQLESCSVEILDLAASADIEDVMLCDYEGVLNYLGLPIDTVMPSGKKGKSIMKKLFKTVALNNKYREGSRARELIRSLDMEKIERNSSIPFKHLEDILFR